MLSVGLKRKQIEGQTRAAQLQLKRKNDRFKTQRFGKIRDANSGLSSGHKAALCIVISPQKD